MRMLHAGVFRYRKTLSDIDVFLFSVTTGSLYYYLINQGLSENLMMHIECYFTSDEFLYYAIASNLPVLTMSKIS